MRVKKFRLRIGLPGSDSWKPDCQGERGRIGWPDDVLYGSILQEVEYRLV